MTAASLELQPWTRRRWWGMVALIIIVQLGLIFWLGSRNPIYPLPPRPATTLSLGDPAPTELQAFNDPTLFILPHPEGFSGPVWGKTYRSEFSPFEWSAPANHFPLAIERLSTVLNQLFQAGDLPVVQLPEQAEAVPTLPHVPPLPIFPDQSLLQLEDGLAQRRLLGVLALKSWPSPEILSPSVVRVGVDDGGRPVSVTLLSRSGSPAADQYALDQAWAAQFEPLNGSSVGPLLKPAARLSWGRMIFRWHTVPTPPASAPAASP
jgi:hypothetical protein